ncbi:CAMK family protein kinase [Histomonas meleagridis]|uniref:CAMK family protein kinase n=1 Tax=Histomonas meleagridis TaxID=135588 RepID=UPI00355AB08C|nr:CAMK family protein kinase [Histomonas meleagridis]KAH0797376.1 CAMK family protein kinase [Histomonas meleagridis]
MEKKQPIGDYILDRNLGSGSSGKVKLARHKVTNQPVAIKIIKKEKFNGHPNILTKVYREIALMRLLHHPNILPLLDILESEHHLFIVEGYAQNGTLLDIYQSLSLEEAMRIFRQIIYGLEYLHQHCICHRDLKPENLLLDVGNNIWIADFGFACWMGPSNIVKTSCGSLFYAAPEVVRGVPYDGRLSDVWSSGGKLPFNGKSVRQTAHEIKKGSYAFPSEANPLVQDLISKILVVDPKLRLTIDQIKGHPAFRIGVPEGYVLPKPLPLPQLTNPIKPTEEDKPKLDCLQQIGFSDLEKLKSLLQSDQPNMAKVFFFMLSQQQESLWDEEVLDSVEDIAFHDLAESPDSLLFLSPDIASTPSLCESFENAHVWLNNEQSTQTLASFEYPIQGIKISCVDLMLTIQQFLVGESYKFLFPNERFIIAKNDVLQMRVNFIVEYESDDSVVLYIQMVSGVLEKFQNLVKSVNAVLLMMETDCGGLICDDFADVCVYK